MLINSKVNHHLSMMSRIIYWHLVLYRLPGMEILKVDYDFSFGHQRCTRGALPQETCIRNIIENFPVVQQAHCDIVIYNVDEEGVL